MGAATGGAVEIHNLDRIRSCYSRIVARLKISTQFWSSG